MVLMLQSPKTKTTVRFLEKFENCWENYSSCDYHTFFRKFLGEFGGTLTKNENVSENKMMLPLIVLCYKGHDLRKDSLEKMRLFALRLSC